MNVTKHLQRHTLWVAFILAAVSFFGAEPIFEDATKSLSLGIGGGQVAWEDLYDGGLWVNERGKKFSRFKGKGPSGHGIWGDYNNDGCLRSDVCRIYCIIFIAPSFVTKSVHEIFTDSICWIHEETNFETDWFKLEELLRICTNVFYRLAC